MLQSNDGNDLLIRFQDRTYVCPYQSFPEHDVFLDQDENDGDGRNASDLAIGHPKSSRLNGCPVTKSIVQYISERTKWPTDYLEVVSWTPPFASVRVVSRIRGGKGGFGTLLRGSYRKQKASVVDYGDCRTLTGQRLRDVVPSATASGETPTTASLLRLPSTGSSLPAWAPLNASRLASKHLRKLEHARKQYERAKEAQKLHKHEMQARKESQVASYVQKASETAKRIENSLQDAIREGLRKKREEKQRKQQEERKRKQQEELDKASEQSSPKRPKTGQDSGDQENEAPPPSLASPASFLACLSGDLDVLSYSRKEKQSVDSQQQQQQQQETNYIIQLRGSSNFGSAVILLQNDLDDNKSNDKTDQSNTYFHEINLYYEVVVVTGGLLQLGWALTTFEPNSEEGLGVGDDAKSWAIDLSRNMKLHNDKEESYGVRQEGSDDKSDKKSKWGAGDIVGCFRVFDKQRNEYHLSYTLNGQDMGIAYKIPCTGVSDDKNSSTVVLLPAVSLNPEEELILHLHEEGMKYLPKTGNPVGRFLATASDDSNTRSDQVGEPETDEKQKSSISEKQDNVNETKAETAKTGALGKGSDAGTAAPRTGETSEANKAPVTDETRADISPAGPLDLAQYESAQQLEALGLERLKKELMALGVKCGGTLQERAKRLFSLKGVDQSNIPKKLLAKK